MNYRTSSTFIYNLIISKSRIQGAIYLPQSQQAYKANPQYYEINNALGPQDKRNKDTHNNHFITMHKRTKLRMERGNRRERKEDKALCLTARLITKGESPKMRKEVAIPCLILVGSR
jgi:hypothetical protein